MKVTFVQVCIHSNITLDEIHGIIYSQNELNNGYLTTIQLVIIFGYLIYRKTFTHSLALELDRPIVVLSQISRAPEYREDHRPILSDFYASDAVIQYADVFSQMSFHSLLYAINFLI